MTVRHGKNHCDADTLVDELEAAELLLVATLRLFAAQYRSPVRPHPEWRDSFCAVAIDECGVPAFQALFDIISAAALRPLDVRCPSCRSLGEDEVRFLQLEGLLQRGQTEAAARILAGWLPTMAARMALLPAQGLANAMTRAGVILPWRYTKELVQPRRRSPSSCADPGLALLQ